MCEEKNIIPKGSIIKVGNNVVETLLKMGFENNSAESMAEFEDTEQTAFNVWFDDENGTEFVTVDVCCEIPSICCTIIEQ